MAGTIFDPTQMPDTPTPGDPSGGSGMWGHVGDPNRTWISQDQYQYAGPGGQSYLATPGQDWSNPYGGKFGPATLDQNNQWGDTGQLQSQAEQWGVANNPKDMISSMGPAALAMPFLMAGGGSAMFGGGGMSGSFLDTISQWMSPGMDTTGAGWATGASDLAGGGDVMSATYGAAGGGGLPSGAGGFTSGGNGGAASNPSWWGSAFGSPGMPGWAQIGLQGIGVLNSLYNSSQMRNMGSNAAALNDPFAAQRPQYQQQLSQLMANPGSITSYPGYQAGLTAVERKGASQGWNGSGNMAASLADYGGNFFKDAVSQLEQLAGANINPSGAGSALIAGNTAANQQQMQALMQLSTMLSMMRSSA